MARFHRHPFVLFFSLGPGRHHNGARTHFQDTCLIVKLCVQTGQIQKSVGAEGHHIVAGAVNQRRGLKTAVFVDPPVHFPVQPVDQGNLLLVVKVVLPKADFPGLVFHLPGVLAHVHVGISRRMQAGRSPHGITHVDCTAGQHAVLQVDKADNAVHAGNNHFPQGAFDFLVLVNVGSRPHLCAPFHDGRLSGPFISVEGLAGAPGAARLHLPDLRQSSRIVNLAHRRVLPESIAAEGQHADFFRRVVIAGRHMNQRFGRPHIILYFFRSVVNRCVCDQ